MSKGLVIAITGTPGVGKSSFSRELSRKINAKLIDLNEFIEENKLYSLDEDKTKLIDHSVLREKFNQLFKEDDQDLVIDGHLSHLLDTEKLTHIIILRLKPEILEGRLKSRGYSDKKIRENIEAEALGVILSEAVDIHGVNKIYEIDTTDKSIENSIKVFCRALENKISLEPGNVDWLEDFFKSKINN